MPTYLFIGSIAVMVVTAIIRMLLGDTPVAESAGYEVHAHELTQAAFVLLLLRSFASGCAALTGVEAISNGVPAFRRPKIRNAQRTLVAMGAIAIVLFSDLTAVALFTGVQYSESPCCSWARRRTSRRSSSCTSSACSSRSRSARSAWCGTGCACCGSARRPPARCGAVSRSTRWAHS